MMTAVFLFFVWIYVDKYERKTQDWSSECALVPTVRKMETEIQNKRSVIILHCSRIKRPPLLFMNEYSF